MTEQKPKGWGAFSTLLKKVVSVPKEKVDAKIAQKREQSTNDPQKK